MVFASGCSNLTSAEIEVGCQGRCSRGIAAVWCESDTRLQHASLCTHTYSQTSTHVPTSYTLNPPIAWDKSMRKYEEVVAR